MENEDPNTVFWIERRGFRGAPGGIAPAEVVHRKRMQAAARNVFLQATPIEVGQILRECLWSKLETSVLTSATLAVGGGFEYIRQRLGLDHARELIVALALRLREPGDPLRPARSARPAHPAIRRRGRRPSSAACSRSLAAAPSSSSPATRR